MDIGKRLNCKKKRRSSEIGCGGLLFVCRQEMYRLKPILPDFCKNCLLKTVQIEK